MKWAYEYPVTDNRGLGKPDWHRIMSQDLIEALTGHRASEEVYVSGNVWLFYDVERKNCRITPNILVVKDVGKEPRRGFRVWSEGKRPDFVLELISHSKNNESIEEKLRPYRNKLCVSEYFCLTRSVITSGRHWRGYRLRRDKYVPIRPVRGRLPSKVLGLRLERHGSELRLFNPSTGEWLPTFQERAGKVETEVERLRRELEQMRRRGEQP